MKKRVAFFLALGLMAGALTGCGGGTTPPPASGSSAGSGSAGSAGGSSAPQELALIIAQRDEWLSVLDNSIVEEAKNAGYEIQRYDAGGDSSKLLDCVEAAKTNGAKALIVNMTESGMAPSIVEAAKDMKVIFVNRQPTDISLLNENTVFIGADESISGKLQGESLAAWFKAQGKDELRYLLISGTEGLEHTRMRSEGAVQALKDAGLIPIPATDPIDCGYDRSKALEAVTSIIGDREFDCVISNNDAMALGAIEAMKQKGLNPKEIPVVGIDLLEDAKIAIGNGDLLMTAFQDAKLQAKCSIKAAVNMINGTNFDKDTGYEVSSSNPYSILIPFELVNQENLEQYK